MDGIQITLHTIDAIIKYDRDLEKKQTLYNLRTFRQNIIINDKLTIIYDNKPIYIGVGVDARTYSKKEFFSHSPLGPYYTWELFIKQVKIKIKE